MGFFFAGYRTKSIVISEIEKYFVEVVPNEVRNDILRIEESTSFLISYGANKVINDVVVRDRETGSWLAIMGTPLVELVNEEKQSTFMGRFFKDPMQVVKTELDGCYALLSYNALTDSFYTATDYNNTTPVYYATTSNGIYISSHELPLARFLHSDIDPMGFSMTIQIKVPWGHITRFKNIQKLLPCHLLIFSDGRQSASKRYWGPPDETQWEASFENVVEKWLVILKNSVQAFYSCSLNRSAICEITAGEDARLLLAQCHNSGIPFLATVDGLDTDIDVRVAKQISRKAGLKLIVRPRPVISDAQLLSNAIYISLMNDAYQDYFDSCTIFATDSLSSPENFAYVKYCGAPGGEAFRGSYYLRAKTLFPSKKGSFDYRFFAGMKYLLDYYPGLFSFSDHECREKILGLVEEALADVAQFPVGIKIDHLLRVFQTCSTGLLYKNPRYLPFATKNMTRSVYNIPPHFKRGGRLTKACTEILYPEIAFIKTQKGVPTIRKTTLRIPLFIPEYISTLRFIASGAASRLFKWTESNKPAYMWNRNASSIGALLSNPPYSDWLSSSQSMITGHLYNNEILDSLLKDLKAGYSRHLPILGRIINQELAFRWVYRQN